jgi:hypothetical protein
MKQVLFHMPLHSNLQVHKESIKLLALRLLFNQNNAFLSDANTTAMQNQMQINEKPSFIPI